MGVPSPVTIGYWEKGYHVERGAIEPELVDELGAFVTEQAGGDIAEAPPKIFDLYHRDTELMDRLVRHPNIVGTLGQILGENIVMVPWLHNHATINTPGMTARLPGWHTDTLHPNRQITTVITYLEKSTVENGGTRILEGSQRIPIIGRPEENHGGIELKNHPDEYEWFVNRYGEPEVTQVTADAGDALFFASGLFHAVGKPEPRPDEAPTTRMSITLAYNTPDERDIRGSDGTILVAGAAQFCGNLAARHYIEADAAAVM